MHKITGIMNSTRLQDESTNIAVHKSTVFTNRVKLPGCCAQLIFSLLLMACMIIGPRLSASGAGVASASNGTAQNGWLHVSGTQLVNEQGQSVVLHGMSSHGLQWYSKFTTKNAIGATAAYGANLFRIAMYTAEGGYLKNKNSMYSKLCAAVDAAIDCNMYVIIDWHILSDKNPKSHQKAAKAFFSKVSARYADRPNVIYEICNEPNGSTTWSQIRSYANAVIPEIRAHSPNALVLVGTPTWSQDVDTAASNPLDFPNIMYTCHFYAGTHKASLRSKIETALSKGCAVFVSEWGTSSASGSGGVYKKESNRWISFMREHGISWANWSYCDKRESSAALKPGANAEDGLSKKELSSSGKYVFSRF